LANYNKSASKSINAAFERLGTKFGLRVKEVAKEFEEDYIRLASMKTPHDYDRAASQHRHPSRSMDYPHASESWKSKSDRNIKNNKVRIRIVNDASHKTNGVYAPYAVFLFTSQPSPGYSKGFRGDYNSKENWDNLNELATKSLERKLRRAVRSKR